MDIIDPLRLVPWMPETEARVRKEACSVSYIFLRSGYDEDSAEARFAAAIDRLEPVLQNHRDDGHSWLKHGVSADKVHTVISQIEKGSMVLWEYTQSLLEESIQKGWLKR